MYSDLQIRREALASILSILEDPTHGIFGYPVCQDCGEVDYFQGFNGAISSHTQTEYGQRFSAMRHNHKINTNKAFCEVCCQSIEPAELLLCPDCRKAFYRYAPEKDWEKMLKHFVRERPKFQGIIGEEDFWEEVAYLHALYTRSFSDSKGLFDE